MPEEKVFIIPGSNNQYYEFNNCFRYHYTDYKKLTKILRSKRFWLMHYKQLNDTTEGRLIFDKLMKRLHRDNKEKLINQFKKLFDVITKNFYVGSFSGFGNKLSQWRSYGNVNIGFDFNNLEYQVPQRFEDKTGENRCTACFDFPRCEYIDDLDRPKIYCYINQILDYYKNLENVNLDDKNKLQEKALTLGAYLFDIKHIGFSEECEYRVVHFLWNVDPFTSFKPKPHLNLPFNENAVKRIVIGPSKEQEKTLEEVLSFLDFYSPEYDHVEVYRSTIPYVETEKNGHYGNPQGTHTKSFTGKHRCCHIQSFLDADV